MINYDLGHKMFCKSLKWIELISFPQAGINFFVGVTLRF
jgi:hypothetical protein